jgi:hypothetical protein
MGFTINTLIAKCNLISSPKIRQHVFHPYAYKRTNNCYNKAITSIKIHIVFWKMAFYRLIIANIAEKRITYKNSTVMEEVVSLLYTQIWHHVGLPYYVVF